MKKVLSLVLSLCLFVSLGAGISFDVADAAFTMGAGDLYWDFMKTNDGSSFTAAYMPTITYDLTTAGSATEMKPAVKSEPFAYFGYTTDQSGSYGNYASSGYGLLMFTAARGKYSTLAMKLKVNTAGKYVPMLNVHGFADYVNSTTYDFYIVPAKGTETGVGDIVLADAVAHKAINHGAYGTYDEFVALSDTPVNIAAGEYFLVARSNQGGKGSFCFDGVIFKNCASNQAISLSAGLNDERYFELNVDEKISIPLSAKLSNGAALDISTSSGWSTSADTSAVHLRLNKENSSLDITGLAPTAANETHWICVGINKAYFNIKVNPKGYEPADRDLTYDWYKPFTEGTTFGGASAYPTTITMGMTTVGSHTEINRWKGSNTHSAASASRNPVSIFSDPIGFYRKDAAANIAMTYHNYGGYIYGTGNLDFIIKVPFDGFFTPSVITTNAAGAAHNFKVMSLDGATTYATINIPKNEMGTFTSETSARLTEGYYLLRHENPTSGTNFFNTFVFKYNGGFSYGVDLNLDGGSLATEFTSYQHKDGATLPIPTKDGYTFAGWYDNAEFAGDAVTAIPANSRGAKTFYAKWNYVPKTFNVTLNANGGTVASELTSYTEGTAVTLPTATKSGYVFGGWYDNADLIGEAVTAIGTDATGDKTFYAKWTLDISAADFDLEASSGYYAYYVSNPNREGVIAISTSFYMFDTVTVEKAGIMIYVAGNENNNAKIARVETNALDAETFSAIFNGIAKENFDKEVLAKAYVVVDGEYFYSDAITTSVDGSRWVGVKPKN